MHPDTLRTLGLTSTEARIYLELFNEDHITPKEISEKFSITIQSLYKMLKRLEKKELINSRGTSPKEYFITNPDFALKEIIENRKKELNEELNQCDMIYRDLSTLYRERFETGHCSKRYAFYSFNDSTKGLDFIRNQIKNAKKELICYDIPLPFLRKLLASIEDVMENFWVALFIDEININEISNELKNLHAIKIFKGNFTNKRNEMRFYLNNREALQAEICVDGERFITIMYSNTDEEYNISSFYSPNMVEMTKRNYLPHIERNTITLDVD